MGELRNSEIKDVLDKKGCKRKRYFLLFYSMFAKETIMVAAFLFLPGFVVYIIAPLKR
jgi:hypothetical protein